MWNIKSEPRVIDSLSILKIRIKLNYLGTNLDFGNSFSM
jgi:hypothetical protein